MNKNTQTFLKVLPVWAWAFFAVVAGASALNDGSTFHLVAGIVTLVGAAYHAIKAIKEVI